MPVDPQKLDFVLREFPALLRMLDRDAKGKWGQMNGQQMVEHFIWSVQNSNGKLQLPLVNEGEILEKVRAFLFSDKQFRENTRNPYLGDPQPVQYPSMNAAIDTLQSELQYMVDTFTQHPGKTIQHPIFGELDFEGHLQILYKHVQHHLRQFGLIS